ncbi:uncharacterized protein LOC128397439 [Panonychus citri]|uniref:uncharacterized protein LOC128397439 n=1 Tax=Panonychus citri TaxID=50023 RepID=UPI0023072876|nr:uncharacterized protein LOC128397439 [Panonychus citri]
MDIFTKRYFETLCCPKNSDLNRQTFEYQEHKPSGFGYVIVNYKNEITNYRSYRGEKCGYHFLKTLISDVKTLLSLIAERERDFYMSEEDTKNFEITDVCHICNKEIIKGEVKVRDHDHFTGKYRGAAHSPCNLKMATPNYIPVVFHNLKNFDSHIILKAIEKEMFTKVKIIPQNMEKYISFKLDNICFLDSYAFLASSLDELAGYLNDDLKNSYLLQLFNVKDLNFVCKKARLPYDYLDSFDRFNETSLPPISAFYNKLKFENLDPKIYQNMCDLWQHFDVVNIGQFQDIYQKIDVVLLAAVFENFRSISVNQFQLDPLHFFSSPGLTWSAALKKTDVEIDLLTDLDMIMMFEKGIRGGISSAMTRFTKANIPNYPDYDKSQENSYITYLDVNNLYGFALQQSMPYSDFRFVKEENFKHYYHRFVTETITHESEEGTVFEVDITYPSFLHDDHNDYPLAPDKTKIDDNLLSETQHEILISTGRKRTVCEKLIPSFLKKSKYVVHYKNLNYYVKKGLVVTKIHRIICFKQKPWLKDYIVLCTKMRMQCSSPFEKNFWKLMVNAIYGKSIEDVRKHSDVRLELNKNGVMKQLRRPMCQRFYILDENKALFKLHRTKCLLNKPIYIGFSVLDFSKLHMYQLHYDIFKPKYRDKISLLYTDTDSFIYHIKTDNVHVDFMDLKCIFDFCDYPKNHISNLYNECNKKTRISKRRNEW